MTLFNSFNWSANGYHLRLRFLEHLPRADRRERGRFWFPPIHFARSDGARSLILSIYSVFPDLSNSLCIATSNPAQMNSVLHSAQLAPQTLNTGEFSFVIPRLPDMTGPESL